MKFLFDSRFGPLYWTQFFGALNDNIFKNALIVLATYKGLSLWGLPTSEMVAAAGGIFILPFFLFSAYAGEIADKFEKTKIVQITKWTEIVIMALGTFGFFMNSMTILMLSLFLMGTQSTFFGPLKYSMIPELVNSDDLVKGNAHVEMGTFIAILIGTIAGGMFAGLENSTFIIGASVIIVGVCGLFTSYKIPYVGVGNAELKLEWNPFPTLKNNFQILRSNKAIFNSALGISWFWFFGAGILSILPVYCKDYLRADENVVTFFLAMFTLGIGAGSMLCEKLSHKRVELGIVPVGALGMSLFIIDLFFVVPSFTAHSDLLTLEAFLHSGTGLRLGFDFLMMSIFGGVFIVPLYTLLQERSVPSERSRIIAGNNVMNAFFMVVSSIMLMGLYKLDMTYPEIFLCYALLNLAVSVYIYSIVPEFTLRFYSWLLVHFIYRLKVTNSHHIPPNGPAVIACNHVSFVDWLLIAGACRRPMRFIMYYKFFEIPLARFLMKHAQVIPIAGVKEKPEILNQAFVKIKEALDAGEIVCIFPEGSLTEDGHTAPFRPGLKKILETNAVPVVPAVIRGIWGGLFTRKKDGRQSLFRKPIEIEFANIMSPENFRLLDLENKIRSMLGESKVTEYSGD